MKNYKNYLSLLFLLLFNQNIYAQTTANNWRKTPTDRIIQFKGRRDIQPETYALYQVDFQLLKSNLNKAPKISGRFN